MTLMDSKTGVRDRLDEAVGGVGGAAGRKTDGMQDTVVMIETISTILSTEPRKGLTSWASCFFLQSVGFTTLYKGELTAPPNGFARLASAVAPTRPRSVNHMSE